MNRFDQIRYACVTAMEKGLVKNDGGWNKDKAAELLTIIQNRPKNKLPLNTSPIEVYEAILNILMSLEDAEPEYVPEWARMLMAG